MSTTIYDSIKKQVATDTRWCSEFELSDRKNYLFYTDDHSFDKIADDESFVMLIAGDGLLVAKWKEWWANSLDFDEKPKTDNNGVTAVSLLIIDKENNEVGLQFGPAISAHCEDTGKALAISIGSGSRYAIDCWNFNKCAITAILTASDHDFYTGDSIKYLSFSDSNTESNVQNNDYNYDSFLDTMFQRGYLMNITSRKSGNDPGEPNGSGGSGTPLTIDQKKEIKGYFAQSRINGSTAIPRKMDYVWTDKEDTKLVSTIKKIKATRKNN